jgi:hypothetical protein
VTWVNKRTNQQALLVVVRVLLWLGVWGCGGEAVIYVATPHVCDCCYCAASLHVPTTLARSQQRDGGMVAVSDTRVHKTRKLGRSAEGVLSQGQFVQHVNRPGIEPGALSVVLLPMVVSCRTENVSCFPSFLFISLTLINCYMSQPLRVTFESRFRLICTLSNPLSSLKQ